MGKLKIIDIFKPKPDDNFIFFGKLIIIAIYSSGLIKKLGYTDLPLMSVFQNNLSSETYFYIWQSLFLLSSILIFFNIKAKSLLILNGVLLIIALMMSELYYSNNIFFAACMLITLSISSKKFNLVPVQLSIVYFGAFIDKLYYKEWRNGDFMTAFFQNNNRVDFLSEYIDKHFLIMSMTYSTLVIEFLLAIFILIPKTRKLTLLLGLLFHFSTIIFMNKFFGIFIVTILISYYSILKTSINFNEKLKIKNLIQEINSIYKTYKTKAFYEIEFCGVLYKKYKGLFVEILLNPYSAVITTLILSMGFVNINIKKIGFILFDIDSIYFCNK